MAADDSKAGTVQRDLVFAKALRDRLRVRAEFWDRWRGAILGPAILAGAGLGYAIGYGVRVAFRLPPTTEFYVAVVGLVAIGRAIAWYFDVSRLDAAQRRVQSLQARAKK